MKHKNYASFIGIIVLIIAIALAVFFSNKKHAEAPVSETGSANTVAASPATGNLITIAPEMVSVAHDSYLSSVGGSYPKFGQAGDAFNQKIADGITSDIADFNKSASADYEAHLKTGGVEFQKEFAKGGFYYFNVKSVVIQSNASYVSVVIRTEGFTGGAHGFHNVITYNYDVKGQKNLSLTDFTTYATASAAARTTLKQVFAKNGDANTYETFALDGTDPAKPENFQAFSFTDKKITLYFGEYQVAPYVYGEQDVTLDR